VISTLSVRRQSKHGADGSVSIDGCAGIVATTAVIVIVAAGAVAILSVARWRRIGVKLM
jgi:hypothetical protein